VVWKRSYREGVLKVPSQAAKIIFTTCDYVLQGKKSQILKRMHNVVKTLLAQLLTRICEKLPDIPTCHFRVPVNRFFKLRFNFWAAQMNKQMRKFQASKLKKTQTAARAWLLATCDDMYRYISYREWLTCSTINISTCLGILPKCSN
jgi:hypothetical protein